MIAFLIDADNLSAPAWIDEAFHLLEKTEGSICIRRAYGSVENLRGLADTLLTWVVRPFVNLPLPKNTTDISLAVDAMELACLTTPPKVMIVGSGDLDFVPLVVRLRERGIRVICISERNKMARDAIRAYDQVIYVGGDLLPYQTQLAVETESQIENPASTLCQRVSVVTKPTKKMVPKSLVAKKAVAKKSADTALNVITVSKIL